MHIKEKLARWRKAIFVNYTTISEDVEEHLNKGGQIFFIVIMFIALMAMVAIIAHAHQPRFSEDIPFKHTTFLKYKEGDILYIGGRESGSAGKKIVIAPIVFHKYLYDTRDEELYILARGRDGELHHFQLFEVYE